MLSNNRSCFASDTFFEHMAVVDILKEFSAFFPSQCGPYFPSLTHKLLFVLFVLRIIYDITEKKNTSDCGADEPLPSMCKAL